MTNLINRTANRYYGIRIPILILIQATLIVVANQAAFWLRFDGSIPPEQQPIDTELLPLLVAIRLGVFLALRLHKGVWRYAGIWDLRNIVTGVTVSSVLFWLAQWSLGTKGYPRSVFIIDALLLICLIGGVRFARRLHMTVADDKGGRRVVIYGAGDAGELIARDMMRNPAFRGTPIGFIDDDVRKLDQLIHGIPVLGSRQQISKIIAKHQPHELLIAIPSASRASLRAIVRALDSHQIPITTLPRLHGHQGQVDVEQIRQLKVEDLLARDIVGLDYVPLRRFLSGKRVLISGAGGSIGSELCRQVAAANPARLILVEQYENSLFSIHKELAGMFHELDCHPVIADITDKLRIDQVFDLERPEVVFHAAAHKHVPLMEHNPCEAVKNNIRGTRICVSAATRFGVSRFVLISTDKAVKPTSIMGATKKVAELVVEQCGQTHATRFTAVRFGNVLGSNGSVVPTFMDQIANGGPVTVTHPEMRRFFMLIPEAVQLVLQAAALDDPAALFVLEMGEQVKVVELARDLIRLSGLVPDKDIEIVFTGLRPGERLFEEIVSTDELIEPSSVDKVLRVKRNSQRRFAGLDQAISRLEEHAIEGRTEEVLAGLRSLLLKFDEAPAADFRETAVR